MTKSIPELTKLQRYKRDIIHIHEASKGDLLLYKDVEAAMIRMKTRIVDDFNVVMKVSDERKEQLRRLAQVIQSKNKQYADLDYIHKAQDKVIEDQQKLLERQHKWMLLAFTGWLLSLFANIYTLLGG